MKSAYQTLGVDRNAGPTEVRAAYRTLAKRWHPDRPDGDLRKFQAIQEAFETLIDEAKRKEHDRVRAQYLAERGAVECPRCGRAVRLKPEGVGSTCPAPCNYELTKWTKTGEFKVETTRLVQGLMDQTGDFVDAVIDLGAEEAKELVRGGQDLLLGLAQKHLLGLTGKAAEKIKRRTR